jgi:hypothetical protein
VWNQDGKTSILIPAKAGFTRLGKESLTDKAFFQFLEVREADSAFGPPAQGFRGDFVLCLQMGIHHH